MLKSGTNRLDPIYEGVLVSSADEKFQLSSAEGRPCFERNNIINCGEVSIDSFSDLFLYKTMKFEYVRQMLDHKQLRLENTSSWDDPYENFFLKEKFIKNGESVDASTLIQQTFGQSWTTVEDCFAFWKLYSPKCESVKIKVNARKQIEGVLLDELSLADTFVGRVEYRSADEINTSIKKRVASSTFQEVWRTVMPEMFYFKRKEFEYEKRKRILIGLGYDENRIYQSQMNNFTPIDIVLPNC